MQDETVPTATEAQPAESPATDINPETGAQGEQVAPQPSRDPSLPLKSFEGTFWGEGENGAGRRMPVQVSATSIEEAAQEVIDAHKIFGITASDVQLIEV